MEAANIIKHTIQRTDKYTSQIRHAASYPPYMHFNLNKSIIYTKQDECIDREGGRHANTFLCPPKILSELNGVM